MAKLRQPTFLGATRTADGTGFIERWRLHHPLHKFSVTLEPGVPVVIQAWVAVAEHDDGRMKRVTCQAPNEVAALLTLQAENPGWGMQQLTKLSMEVTR